MLSCRSRRSSFLVGGVVVFLVAAVAINQDMPQILMAHGNYMKQEQYSPEKPRFSRTNFSAGNLACWDQIKLDEVAISGSTYHIQHYNLRLFIDLQNEWRDHPISSNFRPLTRGGIQTRKLLESRERWEAEDARNKFHLLSKYFNWTSLTQNISILEIGCGTGHVSEYIKKKMTLASVTCLEPTPRPEWSKRKNVTFRTGYLGSSIMEEEKIPKLMENSFDFLFSNVVFEHVQNPQEMIEATFKLLKPGGKMYIYANLYLGWDASHRYREIYFPWPHLLFQDVVFACYYTEVLKQPNTANIVPSWVNRLTLDTYHAILISVGFRIEFMKGIPMQWDKHVEQFYQQFEEVLGRYQKVDLKYHMFRAVVKKPFEF